MTRQKLLHFLWVKEYIIVSLALASMIFFALDLAGNISKDQLEALYFYDIAVGFIFIGEFLLEMYLSSDAYHYFRHNWFYLLAAIPLSYALTELLRGLRIIRIVKLIRVGIHFKYERSIKRYAGR